MIDDLLETTIEESRRLDPQTVIYLSGSYARGDATEKSDIDLLILHQNKRNLCKLLKKMLKSKYPTFWNKLDIKIFNHNELIKIRNEHYFMFFLNIYYGKCLTDNPIKVKLVPQLIHQEFNNLKKKLDQVDQFITLEYDYENLAGMLFGIGKTLCFMETVLTKKRRKLKKVFGRNLAHLGKLYELKVCKNKGIQTSFGVEVKIHGKKKSKGNFARLVEVSQNLREYMLYIESYLDILK